MRYFVGLLAIALAIVPTTSRASWIVETFDRQTREERTFYPFGSIFEIKQSEQFGWHCFVMDHDESAKVLICSQVGGNGLFSFMVIKTACLPRATVTLRSKAPQGDLNVTLLWDRFR